MLDIIKNWFSGTDNRALTEAIRSGACLVDVRTPAEFSAGSATGAVNIPLGSIAAQLAKFRDWEHIVVFCRSGSRSAEAKAVLEKHGFNNVVNGLSWENVQQAIAAAS